MCQCEVWCVAGSAASLQSGLRYRRWSCSGGGGEVCASIGRVGHILYIL